MINIRLKKQRGAALLILAIILLLAMTGVIFMLAKQGLLSQKVTANEYRATQAFEAAEAGIEFGIVYLEKNRTTIVKDTNADGYIDNYSNSSTSNVALANGSKFTITYSNPTANDLSIVLITSVGTSSDGTSTREVRQLVKYTPTLVHFSNYPLVTKGNLTLSGSTLVQNTETNTTIQTGGTVNLNGGAKTVTSSGTSSTSSSTKSDISQNNSALYNQSLETFFTSYFGAPASSVQSSVANYYQNSSSTNYNSLLNGKNGTSIWIEQTGGQAVIDSTTVVGSINNPVLLIVNGDLKIAGSAQIFGYVFVTGTLTTTGSAYTTGGVTVGGNVVDSGNFTLSFSNTVLNNVQQLIGSYGKIPGSWNDIKQ